jgi:hypothetical protein
MTLSFENEIGRMENEYWIIFSQITGEFDEFM